MPTQNPEYRGHAVALFSGGLDSALAVILMLRQDIRVTALTFMTHFGCDISDRSSCGADPYPVQGKPCIWGGRGNRGRAGAVVWIGLEGSQPLVGIATENHASRIGLATFSTRMQR